MGVYIVQHSYEKDGCEETKFIGVYSNEEHARQAVIRLSEQPGFRDRPKDFFVNEYQLDEDNWTEGFATMTSIHTKKNDGTWMVVQAECLPDGYYRINELYENDLLGEFKHLDIVRCEERNDELFAIELIQQDS